MPISAVDSNTSYYNLSYGVVGVGMFVKGSLSFDLNGVKCTRKAEKTPRKVLTYKSSKSVNGLRQKVEKTCIFGPFCR